MARPLKNSCDYYPHDSGMRNHKKIKAIRQKFGITGYAIWVMLLELLTGSDGNEFEDSELELELISGDFGVSVTEIREMLDYCYRLELLFIKNGFVSSESLNERLAPVYQKRKITKTISANQRRKNGKFHSNTVEDIVSDTNNSEDDIVSGAETPQIKVNKSKVNKSKVNNNNNTFYDFFDIYELYSKATYESQSDQIKARFSKETFLGYKSFVKLFETFKKRLPGIEFPLLDDYQINIFLKFTDEEIMAGINKMFSLGLKKDMVMILRLIECIGWATKNNNSNEKKVVTTQDRLESQRKSMEQALAYQKEKELKEQE